MQLLLVVAAQLEFLLQEVMGQIQYLILLLLTEEEAEEQTSLDLLMGKLVVLATLLALAELVIPHQLLPLKEITAQMAEDQI
jgi:uncharacterized membrane protein